MTTITRTLVLSLVLLFAGPALADTAGIEHHGPKKKVVVVKKVRPAIRRRTRRPRIVKKYPRRRVVRRRVVRRRTPRRTVVRRTVVHTAPATTVVRRTGPLPVRAANPFTVSFTQKGMFMSGVELGLNIGPFIELDTALGITTTPVSAPGCKGPGCDTYVAPTWSVGVKAIPLRSQLSPYIHLGAMGNMVDPDQTVGLIGAGVDWRSESGFAASLGIDYAIAETNPETAIVPTLKVGFAF